MRSKDSTCSLQLSTDSALSPEELPTLNRGFTSYRSYTRPHAYSRGWQKLRSPRITRNSPFYPSPGRLNPNSRPLWTPQHLGCPSGSYQNQRLHLAPQLVPTWSRKSNTAADWPYVLTRPRPEGGLLDYSVPAIALLANQCTSLLSGSKVSSQKTQAFDCQFKHSIQGQNLMIEWGGRVSGAGLFPWGTEEAIVNFQLVERRPRDIVGLILAALIRTPFRGRWVSLALNADSS